ncbi:hypothetical protein C0058_25705 [Pseudomonas sp. NC02]|nr:hypothetical protein C0058_25705 [Pseudomonas sp. NC02]
MSGKPPTKIAPTLCVGAHPVTLRVTILRADAERPELHPHAERGNDRVRGTYPAPGHGAAFFH